jgi:preprotein translocase subunit SecY
MISAFFNIRKIPELRNRVLFTLLMIVLYRIGCAITCPGVNASVLRHYFSDRVQDASGGGSRCPFQYLQRRRPRAVRRLFAGE